MDVLPAIVTDLAHIGRIANEYASQNVFTDYQERIAPNTLRRQRDDLVLFADYLAAAGVQVSGEALLSQPGAWHGVTHGLVSGFVRWMVQESYAIGSVNVRLATVKKYCALCAKSGVLSITDFALIKMVEGYRSKEGRNLDKLREKTRRGDKKAEPVSINKEQAKALKTHPDTPQGRRDAVLMCLLLDHGLRCGEVQALTVQDVNLQEGLLVFYREKVDKQQIHRLTQDSFIALIRYIQIDVPNGKLLMGSRKGGRLCGGMSNRAITDRVKVLGEAIELIGLSAHDCRHYWSTSAVKAGTDIKALQDAGGWNSPMMPLRYAESGKIANDRVKLE